MATQGTPNSTLQVDNSGDGDNGRGDNSGWGGTMARDNGRGDRGHTGGGGGASFLKHLIKRFQHPTCPGHISDAALDANETFLSISFAFRLRKIGRKQPGLFYHLHCEGELEGQD